METPLDLEKSAEQGNAIAIIQMASKKSIQGKYREGLAMFQRYHIRLAQDDACCTDKSLGMSALNQIEKVLYNQQQKAFLVYFRDLSQAEYNKLFHEQLDWIDSKMKSDVPLPEPMWLETYCLSENKKDLFVPSSEWFAKRAEVITQFRSKLG